VAKRPKTAPAFWLEALIVVVACHHDAASDESGASSGQGEASSGSASASAGGSEDASSEAGDSDSGLPPPDCAAPEIACGQECADLQSDPNNCGGCGIGCVGPMSDAACEAGMCTLGTCELGFADCDGASANGCEHAIDCESGDACATTCGSTGTLGCGDPCAPSCAAPAEVCNALDEDCDGACDQGPLAGCRKGIHRATGSLGHFYTDNVNEVTSNGFTMEAQDFFFVYAGGVDGLLPMFRCIKAGGRRFLTSSTDCEMTGGPELTLGFMAPDDRCGAIPLYRVYAPASDDHFYTISLAERDNAIAMYGYQDQGITGYVWTSL
jgi:hypothetical protein